MILYFKILMGGTDTTKTATGTANTFLDYLLILYGVPLYLLAEKEAQFVGKYLHDMCFTLGQVSYCIGVPRANS